MKIFCGVLVLCVFLVASGPLWAADPVAVEIHYQSGVKYFKRGLYDKAIQEFEKTLEMEPQHPEAQEYLGRVRALQKTHRPAEARASEDARIKALYDEGRRLYRAKKYEEAIEVFNNILILKPIDDFASFYRERCEILISKKLARAKKLEERSRQQAEKREARSAARVKESAPSVEKKEGKAAIVPPAPSAARQEKVSRSELRRQEKLRLKEERRAEVERRREAKRSAQEEKRQEKLARTDALRGKKEEDVAAARGRHEQEEAGVLDKRTAQKKFQEERREIKERFLEGVNAYGHKDYREAIVVFKDVIKAEEKTGALYTRSAVRLMDKARKKLAE